MQILEHLQFWLSVFYHFIVVNKYRKSWKFEKLEQVLRGARIPLAGAIS